jgi:hypothetical protein
MGIDPENAGACKIHVLWLEKDKKKRQFLPPRTFLLNGKDEKIVRLAHVRNCRISKV